MDVGIEWEKSDWAILIHTAVFGKAAIAAMPQENKLDYDEVKSVILKAYELRPEAYRQKYRNYRKYEKQTFVEFVDKQSILFDTWVRSENVDSGYDNLRELILKEQLNSWLPEDIKTYLAEEAPENLKKSAELADDCSLIHKHDRWTPQRFSYGNSSAAQNNKTGVSTNSNVEPNNMNKGQSDSRNEKQNNQVVKQKPKCYHCRKSGDIISDY